MPYLTPTADAFLTVYVSIGNSDDKLTQTEWVAFIVNVRNRIKRSTAQIHGEWHSAPTSRYQNACWCFEIGHDDAALLRRDLTEIRMIHHQDSIAWAFVPETEFI